MKKVTNRKLLTEPNATIYDRYFKYKFVSSLNGFRNIICCKNKIRGYSYNNLLKIVVRIDTACNAYF